MLTLLENDLLVLPEAVSKDKGVIFKPDLGLFVDYVANVFLKCQIETFENMHDVRFLIFFLVAKVVKVLLEDSDKKRQVIFALLAVNLYLLADALAEVQEELTEPQRK